MLGLYYCYSLYCLFMCGLLTDVGSTEVKVTHAL